MKFAINVFSVVAFVALLAGAVALSVGDFRFSYTPHKDAQLANVVPGYQSPDDAATAVAEWWKSLSSSCGVTTSVTGNPILGDGQTPVTLLLSGSAVNAPYKACVESGGRGVYLRYAEALKFNRDFIVKNLTAIDGCGVEPCRLTFKGQADRKSTRLNSSHSDRSRMPSSA